MAYVEDNWNPHGENMGDCLVRALALIFKDELTYFDILADLSYKGLEHDKDWRVETVFKELLLSSYEYDMIKLVPHERFTVNQWTNLTENLPAHTVHMVITNNHAVAISTGEYHDTFDSGRRIVKSIYIRGHELDWFEQLLKTNDIDYHMELQPENETVIKRVTPK